MSSSESERVVVVGAGAVGCAAGRALATDHDVVVVDEGEVGGRASGMAAGLTAPTLFAHDHPAVARYANEFLREFSGTEGFEYHPRSRMELVYTEDEELGREQAERMASAGFPVSFVPAETVTGRHPSFDMERFAGAIEIADAGYVDDTYVYTRALARDAQSRGATFRTNCRVTDVVVDGGQVVGVETEEGRIDAAHVVVAAGWQSKALLADLVHLPLRPFLLQAVSVEIDGGIDPTFPLGRLAAEDVYFRPQNDGRLRLGGGEYLIDDATPHDAGVDDAAHVESLMAETGQTAQEVVNNGVDDAFRERAREVATLFLTAFSDPTDVDVVTGWGAVDAATADGEPIVDRVAGVDGLVVATGFNGLGITKSPVVGPLVRACITGDDAPLPSDPFRIDRLPAAVDFPLQDTFAMGRQ